MSEELKIKLAEHKSDLKGYHGKIDALRRSL